MLEITCESKSRAFKRAAWQVVFRNTSSFTRRFEAPINTVANPFPDMPSTFDFDSSTISRTPDISRLTYYAKCEKAIAASSGRMLEGSFSRRKDRSWFALRLENIGHFTNVEEEETEEDEEDNAEEEGGLWSVLNEYLRGGSWSLLC